MEQQLQEAEHDAKHDADSGKLLENLKSMDAQKPAEMANMVESHGTKPDEHTGHF